MWFLKKSFQSNCTSHRLPKNKVGKPSNFWPTWSITREIIIQIVTQGETCSNKSWKSSGPWMNFDSGLMDFAFHIVWLWLNWIGCCCWRITQEIMTKQAKTHCNLPLIFTYCSLTLSTIPSNSGIYPCKPSERPKPGWSIA